MADLADTLRTIPLFSALSREDIAKVLGRLEERSFAAGITIFSQGEKGDSFYFIQSGAVQVVLESAGGRRENIAVFGHRTVSVKWRSFPESPAPPPLLPSKRLPCGGLAAKRGTS